MRDRSQQQNAHFIDMNTEAWYWLVDDHRFATHNQTSEYGSSRIASVRDVSSVLQRNQSDERTVHFENGSLILRDKTLYKRDLHLSEKLRANHVVVSGLDLSGSKSLRFALPLILQDAINREPIIVVDPAKRAYNFLRAAKMPETRLIRWNVNNDGPIFFDPWKGSSWFDLKAAKGLVDIEFPHDSEVQKKEVASLISNLAREHENQFCLASTLNRFDISKLGISSRAQQMLESLKQCFPKMGRRKLIEADQLDIHKKALILEIDPGLKSFQEPALILALDAIINALGSTRVRLFLLHGNCWNNILSLASSLKNCEIFAEVGQIQSLNPCIQGCFGSTIFQPPLSIDDGNLASSRAGQMTSLTTSRYHAYSDPEMSHQETRAIARPLLFADEVMHSPFHWLYDARAATCFFTNLKVFMAWFMPINAPQSRYVDFYLEMKANSR